MSHQPERKEKNCLNCDTTVIGRYCHVCGQENIEIKESFWSLTQHFVFDLFHFDGKFFYTVKYLFTRPAWVAKEYCLGKRASFLHPIRMYLFTSAIFFLIFFSIGNFNFQIGDTKVSTQMSKKDRLELAGDYEKKLNQHPNDTVAKKVIALLKDTSKEISGDDVIAVDPSPIPINGRNYSSIGEYDSVQNSLPSNKRDGWFAQMIAKRSLRFNEKYKGHTSEGLKIFRDSFLHRLPYMLFISLPFFALILKLLYIRRKNFYYSDHAIFTIYHYILSFILLLCFFCVNALQTKTGWGFLSFISLILFFSLPAYLLLEMKNFYRQNWWKTTLKFLLLDLAAFILLIALFIGLIFFSVFEL